MKEYYISIINTDGIVFNGAVIKGYMEAFEMFLATLKTVVKGTVVDLIDWETAEVIATNYE